MFEASTMKRELSVAPESASSSSEPSPSSSTKHPRFDQQNSTKAPMFITIGPQCCGKTTWVRSQQQSQIEQQQKQLIDVCLDDQPGVYKKIPTNLWLRTVNEGQHLHKQEHRQQNESLMNPTMTANYYGKTIRERITDGGNAELSLLLQRWSNHITPQEFELSIGRHYAQQHQHQQQNSRRYDPPALSPQQLTRCFVDTVEAFLHHTVDGSNIGNDDTRNESSVPSSPPPPLPDTIDLFCVEALFRKPDPSENHGSTFNDGIGGNMSAIDRAHEKLRRVPHDVAVSWGNTNSKPRDYQTALDIAAQQGRPVRFVVCHPDNGNNGSTDQFYGEEDGIIQLPWLSLPSLLHRNLNRLASTGRYIPLPAIADCCQRISNMVSSKQQGSNLSPSPSPSPATLSPASSLPSSSSGPGFSNQNGAPRFDRRRMLVSAASSRDDDYTVTKNGYIEKRTRHSSNNNGYGSSNYRNYNNNHNNGGYNSSHRGRGNARHHSGRHRGDGSTYGGGRVGFNRGGPGRGRW